MTYPELLSSLYREHPVLIELWKHSVDMSGETGVFAFSPESYGSADDMKGVRFEFWTGTRLTEYLRGRGSTDKGYRDLVDQIDPRSEFLAFIEEEPDTLGRRPVHVHRVGPLGHN